MNDDILNDVPPWSTSEPNYGTEMHGPFVPFYELSHGGIRVPYISLTPIDGSETMYSITVDRRFGMDAPLDEIQRWMFIVANAMAVAAGYPCFGRDLPKKNPFCTRVVGMGDRMPINLSDFDGVPHDAP